MQLASKSSAKRMEAELASLKRDAAQAAAAHKQAIASWHSRVDQSEAEVNVGLDACAPATYAKHCGPEDDPLSDIIPRKTLRW